MMRKPAATGDRL